MSKTNLQARIDRLKYQKVFLRVPWGKIYNAMREMYLKTTGQTDDEEFEKAFIKQNGTREQFIQSKKKTA